MAKDENMNTLEENEEESSSKIYDEDEARMILGI